MADCLSWLMASTLGSRLKTALDRANLRPASAARLAGTTEATLSNWLKDNVKADHVKALQLFRISEAVKVDPRELLLGERASSQFRIAEPAPGYQSQPVKPELWTIAIQLVIETLKERNVDLPPAKQAEAMMLAYDLLDEGMPRAKVLRFVLAAVA